MSRILKVSQSDYRLIVKSGGTITLDTGVDTGTVVITGDLLVKGETTTVNTTNLNIEDNIIRLNVGEGGPGITEITSGIEIERGYNGLTKVHNAQFIFSEDITHYDQIIDDNISGTWSIQTVDELGNAVVSGIQVGTITNDSANPRDIVFDLQDTDRVLTIKNSTNYSSRVLADDDIPNKKFVEDWVLAYDGYAVVDKIFSPVTATPGTEDTLVKAQTTSITFAVKQLGVLTQKAQISSAGLDVNNVRLAYDTISNTSLSANLILTATNNNVEINGVLNLDDQGSTPTAASGKTRLYSTATPGPGKTGLYFKNLTTADELVAKNRAVLLSMIF